MGQESLDTEDPVFQSVIVDEVLGTSEMSRE